MLFNEERATRLMNEKNLVAVIATSPENVQYLTGHSGWGRRVYREAASYGVFALEPERGIGLVVDNAMESAYLASDGTVAGTVATYGAKAPVFIPAGFSSPSRVEQAYVAFQDESKIFPDGAAALVFVLKSMGLRSGRVAVDETSCTPELLTQLRAEFPGCEFLEGADGLLLLTRLVKTDEELVLMRKAAEINEAAKEALYANIRPGATELDAVRAWHETAAGRGGSWKWMHFATGPRAADIFPPTERVMQAGDPFTFDAGLTYRNYNADNGGCGIIGEPDAKLLHDFEAIELGMARTLDIVRAGVTGGELYSTLIGTIREAGLPRFEGSFAGHTIGLQPRELPNMFTTPKKLRGLFIPDTSEIPLPANATINLEAPFAVMGGMRYQYEVTILVTDNGWESLTPQDVAFKALRI